MEVEKNIYGLSEGVFKACEFLGLQFPLIASYESHQEHFPSDYFGENFEFDSAMIKKLCDEIQWTEEKFGNVYKNFSNKFATQSSLKQNKTDLNIYFCDFVLFAVKLNAIIGDYFNYEFYKKPLALRGTFILERHRDKIRMICNEFFDRLWTRDKAKTYKLFKNFFRRDFLDTRACTFEKFRIFVKKHPRFLSKLFDGSLGKNIRIINVAPKENLRKLFTELRNKKSILEEIVVQHKDLAAVCPDTVNTVRVNTFLDIHNAVHILTTSGRFGRVGGIVDNVITGGGCSVIIDPKTGIIISDGLSASHERWKEHPDTGKTFRGFQYPAWDNVIETVTEMAKKLPYQRHVGWDIAINSKGKAVLIEANSRPDVALQQAADSVGRLHLYRPLLEELQNFQAEQMRRLGWRVNNFRNFYPAYEENPARKEFRLKVAIGKLLPDCESLIDLGCRSSKFVKKICPANVKYFPVDFKKFDDEVIACDFNEGDFPDIKADAILCALTAEYVEPLPQFLNNMCRAAQKQILMWCRPVDKEIFKEYRWEKPFVTDFTEEFLIKTMEQNNFRLDAQYPAVLNPSVILYDFRRI